MPIPAATPHANGTLLDWSAVETNLAAYRGWVNSIPAADVGDEAFEREHLVLPEVVGFPRQSFESPFQGAWWRTYGLNDRLNGAALQDWGRRVERLTIYPAALQRNAEWHTPIGARLFLPESSDVRVTATGEAVVTGNNAVLTYDLSAGSLLLRTRQLSTGAVVDRAVSEHQLRPGADTHRHQTWGCTFGARLGPGKWDVSLVYRRGSGSLDVYQIDLGQITFKVEAH